MTEPTKRGPAKTARENFNGIGMTSLRTRQRLIGRLRDKGIADPVVLAAMAEVPRHIFVDEALSHRAYEDASLPIGYNQTLSQPYIVARMTQLVVSAIRETAASEVSDTVSPRRRKVLEIGTGSGYQTAVLAQCCETVYSVERISGLLAQAQDRFRRLELNNIHCQLADGMLGWPDRRQRFDVIIATAAPGAVPQPLLDQLIEGGTLILPVGEERQHLTTIRRQDGEFVTTRIEEVRFVPLLSGLVGS
jgi:protein-L-isoaspartate(D-aspartate) O-methyltransferase|tara:strand:- start:16964 stop:17707 length:744 start_codon:yes stop_codon:yes gene_type:complete